MKTIGMIFSENIRERMKELDLNQDDLSKRLKVNQPMVSKWLSGKITPGPESQKKICEALECDIERLIRTKTSLPDKVLLSMQESLAQMEAALASKNDSPNKLKVLAVIDTLDESQMSLALTALKLVASGVFPASNTAQTKD